jgi:hypothetical protein
VTGKSASHFDPEIPEGHELQFELLTDGAVAAAIPGKPTGRLALEFAFAEIADIRADHEGEDVLGIDALGMSARRKQYGEAQDGRPERFCAGRHSHSGSHGWMTNRSGAGLARTLSQVSYRRRDIGNA